LSNSAPSATNSSPRSVGTGEESSRSRASGPRAGSGSAGLQAPARGESKGGREKQRCEDRLATSRLVRSDTELASRSDRTMTGTALGPNPRVSASGPDRRGHGP
jgi:hypothetical protein